MVLPRFTLRFLLLLTAVFAVASLVFAQAYQGRAWAVAFSLTLAAGAVLLSFHALIFGAAALLNRLLRVGVDAEARSPFASAAPVKQVVLPPVDAD